MTVEPFSLEVPGGTIRGDRRAGADDRPTVLLLHGGGQTRHSWGSTADRLAQDGWPVITLDARGHGDSDWREDRDYSIAGFAADLQAVIRTLEQPPVVVGASLGGITGLVVASRHPELVAGLVLVDVVVRFESAGLKRIGGFLRAHTDGFASLEEVADAVEAYTPGRERERNLDGLRKNVRLRDDGRWYWHWDPAFLSPSEGPPRSEQLARLREAATQLTMPVLIVQGLQSDIVSDAGVEEMLALVPHAEVARVARAGHMVAGDDNAVFADGLEDFLQRVTRVTS